MHNTRLRSSRVLLKQRRSSPKLELSVGCRSRPCPEPTLAGLVLDYTLHCERAEPRIFFADLLLRITSDVPPRLDFVHVLELENDNAVRWQALSVPWNRNGSSPAVAAS